MFRLVRAARDIVPRTPRCRSISTILVTRSPASLPAKDRTDLHPIVAGELFSGKYEALRPLGRGRYSTVWLVRDTRTQEEAAMKLMAAALTEEERGPDELGIMTLLREGNSDSIGRQHVCELLDSFVHEGPKGKHICLVLEQLGMSILDVYRSFGGSLPLILLQRVARDVLYALQYTHECGVIHTDIKGDNILLTGIDFPEGQTTTDVEIAALVSTRYKLTDFGSANKTSHRWAAVIQPLALRSPEVLIGAPWDTKTDIWNFGCLMYEFARGAVLFDPLWQNEETGLIPTQTHLAQMAGLLGAGAFSPKFLATGERAKEYFRSDGTILEPAGYGAELMDLLLRGGHAQQELAPFVNFLSGALVVDPAERRSAAQLLEHPWIQGVPQ
ncbi:kinase-like domain-containing protein [Mycena filopes]|nr:kinase-like domain-containing protein [Mycena filopes]